MKHYKTKKFIMLLSSIAMILSAPLYGADPKKSGVQHMTFEGSLIEGQMGTIKALIVTTEKRPEFEPMALQLGHKKLDLQNVSEEVVGENKYEEMFEIKLPE